MPLVSIIVPCYNQGHYLPETLDSVIAQTYTNWECVIVNDGSSDETENVAKKYCGKDSRFVYMYQDNKGLAEARNSGIRHSQGSYILPLDSDDKIHATYCEKAIAYFELHPEVKLVYCRARRFGEVNCEWQLPPYNYNSIIWENCIFCSAFFRRDDYNKTKGYNSNMKYGWEDWDFWLSLLDEDSIVHRIGEELFFYRIKKKSMVTELQPHCREMCEMIYRNHRDKYESVCEQVVWFHFQAEQHSNIYYQRYMEVCSSHAYRLGKFILRPFSWVRRRLRK